MTILQHPRSRVQFNPAPQPAPVPDVQPIFTPPTDEEWRRLDGCEAVLRLVDEFGAQRVSVWLKNLAELRGEAI